MRLAFRYRPWTGHRHDGGEYGRCGPRRLRQGEATHGLGSRHDLWDKYDAARSTLFAATQTGKPPRATTPHDIVRERIGLGERPRFGKKARVFT